MPLWHFTGIIFAIRKVGSTIFAVRKLSLWSIMIILSILIIAIGVAGLSAIYEVKHGNRPRARIVGWAGVLLALPTAWILYRATAGGLQEMPLLEVIAIAVYIFLVLVFVETKLVLSERKNTGATSDENTNKPR